MSQFAVLHVQKLSKIGGFETHIRRHHLPHRADPEKVHLNEIIFRQPGTLEEAIERRIKEGHTVQNKDGAVEKIHVRAVRAASLMLTGSHERMHEIYADKALFESWKQANFEFVKNELGEANIMDMSVHLDEKTPHIHCVFVPISSQNRLSYSSFFDGTLVEWQDRYGKAMKGFDLGRGISKRFTDKKHQDTLVWEKKQVKLGMQIREEVEKKTEEISAKNVFKLGEIRENQTRLVSNLVKENKKLQEENKAHTRTNKSLFDSKRQQVYEQSLNESMAEKLDWIKINIEIGPFLKERGWQRHHKSTKKDEIFIHPTNGEKIIVSVNPKPNGHYVFWYPNTDSDNKKGGSLIDLLRKERWDWKQIQDLAQTVPLYSVKHSVASEKKSIAKAPIEEKEAREKAQAYLDTIVKTTGKDFLATRQIEKRVHTSFKGLKVSQQAAVFSLYKNFDKEGKAGLCSNITYTHKTAWRKHNKYFQEGLPRGISVLVDTDYSVSDVKRIIVTESPIDALSYRQLQLDGRLHQDKKEALTSSAFLSTCGTLSAQNKDDLRIVFEMAAERDQTVVLAFDNDLAGRKMSETLVHIAEESGCTYAVETPKIGKDWNEQLCEKQGENIHQGIAERKWDIFEEAAYEKSLLPLIAIEKDTFEAFKGSLKASERDIIVALKKDGEEAITSTWQLRLDSKDKFRISEEDAPAISILKGDPKEASELVIVSSPIDALVHYQGLEAKGDICYVMVAKEKMGAPLLTLVEQENWGHVTVASGKKNEEGAATILRFLAIEKQEVEHVHLDVYTLQKQIAENLGTSKKTIEAFKDKVEIDLGHEQGAEIEDNGKTEEKKNAFSLIYGNAHDATNLILVASDKDAMLHYEAQKKTGVDMDKTCYLLFDGRDKGALKESVKRLKTYAQKKNIEIHIVAGKENMAAARSMRYAFKEDSMRVYNERLKKEVPLVSFLEKELGWQRDKENSNLEVDVLIHPINGEKITVPINPKSNGHRVFSYADGGGGTLIDLLIEEKWDWKKIAKLAESKFLPRLEEIKPPTLSQNVGVKHKEDSNALELEAKHKENFNIASSALGLLSNLMNVTSINSGAGSDDEDDDDEEKKEKRQKGRGLKF